MDSDSFTRKSSFYITILASGYIKKKHEHGIEWNCTCLLQGVQC